MGDKHPFVFEAPPISLTSGVEEEVSEDGLSRRLLIDGKVIVHIDHRGNMTIAEAAMSNAPLLYRSSTGRWVTRRSDFLLTDETLQLIAQAIVLATHIANEKVQ